MYNVWYFVAFYAVLLQNILFLAIYAVFRKIGLLQFTRYCVEKILAKISDRGEKMTNIRYECKYQEWQSADDCGQWRENFLFTFLAMFGNSS